MKLTGHAAREFLAEMKRIENLPRDSEEFVARAAFLEECRRIYEAMPCVTEGRLIPTAGGGTFIERCLKPNGHRGPHKFGRVPK